MFAPRRTANSRLSEKSGIGFGSSAMDLPQCSNSSAAVVGSGDGAGICAVFFFLLSSMNAASTMMTMTAATKPRSVGSSKPIGPAVVVLVAVADVVIGAIVVVVVNAEVVAGGVIVVVDVEVVVTGPATNSR